MTHSQAMWQCASMTPGGRRSEAVPTDEPVPSADLQAPRHVDVLVADHNCDVVQLVVEVLARAGLSSVAVHDEASALAALETWRPRVMVLEPVGLWPLGRLRAASVHMAIVVLSALDAVDAGTAAAEIGTELYLTKPFSCRELLECIRACLSTEEPGRIACPVAL